MSIIIAMANHKGGVGKTTSVASIGAALAKKRKRVLLVDLDAQANLTGLFLKEDDADDRETVYDALVGGKPLPVVEVGKNLHLVPSGLEMARAESDLAGQIAREYILRDRLEPVAMQYDYVILDCPPSLGIVTTNALIAATDIYVPLTAEALPLKGMKMLEEYVAMLRRIKREIAISGVFITRFNNRTLNRSVEEAIAVSYPNVVFKTKIRENISVAESPLTVGSIFDYAPESNGALDYLALSSEILKRHKS